MCMPFVFFLSSYPAKLFRVRGGVVVVRIYGVYIILVSISICVFEGIGLSYSDG